MRLLFDSSAIIALSEIGGAEAFIDHATTPLARYEIGNAVWRKVNLTHELAADAGGIFLARMLEDIEFMTEVEIDDAEAVLDVAVREQLTYYDASYIRAAVVTGAALVTEDAKLRRAAEKYIEATDSRHLPN